MIKPWYKSKTKVGAVLIGGGMVLTALGQLILGDIDANAALINLGTGFGVILIAVGLRDAIEKK